MKRSTIWILTVLMAVTFMGLLYTQIQYMRNIVTIRYEQFTEGVKQSLYGVSALLEQDEAKYFLEEGITGIESRSIIAQYKGTKPKLQGIKYSFTTTSGLEADITLQGEPSEISRLQSDNSAALEMQRKNQQHVEESLRDQYEYQRNVLDGVIVNLIAQSSGRPITERANPGIIRQYLRRELDARGLNVPFEFAITDKGNVTVYASPGFKPSPEEHDNVFTHTLFPFTSGDDSYVLKVYFPTKKDYIYQSISFMLPSFAFIIVLLIIFVFTIIVVFRQKKLTEMKNDFINNMTHEFKTPISSISLAAQMLNDQSVRKSPTMLQQISRVITDETKRLRFQVEKVLQMSMFDRQKSTLKIQEVDANAAIFNIVNTFKLKVEKYGGQIEANLDAEDAIVAVDEMHFTNVIFNLLDNAVKYRSEERPLHLTVTSRDISGHRLQITIADNGIGIRREDLKRIFEKFYRVRTGNRHDVKGFGLGLAYVYKMVRELGGEIHAESEFNSGSKFIIILPLTKN